MNTTAPIDYTDPSAVARELNAWEIAAMQVREQIEWHKFNNYLRVAESLEKALEHAEDRVATLRLHFAAAERAQQSN